MDVWMHQYYTMERWIQLHKGHVDAPVPYGGMQMHQRYVIIIANIYNASTNQQMKGERGLYWNLFAQPCVEDSQDSGLL